eukprot:m.279551 g.279551  ORF g.279551 m.279551 type:complete len:155 (+) comp54906_c1_seq3:263-727(+)
MQAVDEAVGLLEACIAFEPRSTYMWDLGSLHVAVGRATAGLPWLHRSTAADQKNIIAAQIAFSIGDDAKGVYYCERFLEGLTGIEKGAWRTRQTELALQENSLENLRWLAILDRDTVSVLSRALPTAYQAVRVSVFYLIERSSIPILSLKHHTR